MANIRKRFRSFMVAPMAGLLLWAHFLVVAATVAAVFAQPSEASERVVLAVPEPSLSFVPFYLGKKGGLYDNEGIGLEIIRMKTDLVSAGLVSGDVQYGLPLSNFVRAAASGIPVRLVMSIERRIAPYDFITTKDIASAKQLKGQPIGITARNGNLHLTAVAVLSAHGLSAQDVTFLSYPGVGECMKALEAGAIKAGIFPPPLNVMLLQKGYPLLAHGSDYYKGPLQGLAASERYLGKNRQRVVAMIRATLRSIRYVKEQPADATAFIEKHQRADPGLAKTLYGYLVDQGTEDGEITEGWVRERLDEMKRLGGTPEVSDPKKILDLGPLREARASLPR